jgi:hypothetical protein
LEAQPGFATSTVRLAQANRERHGPYADLDWTWPLLWKFSFRTQDSFAAFGPAHNDSPIDTLYRNDATQTLNLKLFPNLSIGPSIERFDYENKSVAGSQAFHLRSWIPSIKLTYSFDLLEGSKISKSMLQAPSSAGASQ